MLIPTDPVNFETYSEVHGGSKVKHDLLEFYHDHVNKKKTNKNTSAQLLNFKTCSKKGCMCALQKQFSKS